MFNYVLKYYYKKPKNYKKKYDFVIYNRNHENKKNLFSINLIKKLLKQKFSIAIIGDKLNLINVKNLGFINNKTVNKIQSQSKFSITSVENIYSLFTIECLSNNVKVLVDKKQKKEIFFKKELFVIKDLKKCNDFSFLKKLN